MLCLHPHYLEAIRALSSEIRSSLDTICIRTTWRRRSPRGRAAQRARPLRRPIQRDGGGLAERVLRGPAGHLPEHHRVGGDPPPHPPVLGVALHRARRDLALTDAQVVRLAHLINRQKVNDYPACHNALRAPRLIDHRVSVTAFRRHPCGLSASLVPGPNTPPPRCARKPVALLHDPRGLRMQPRPECQAPWPATASAQPPVFG